MIPKARPALSIVVQFFNRQENVKPIAESLNALGNVELIICDDGSIDGTHAAWLNYLTSDDVLIHSNDVHELRAYDRAARIAQADVICFLQDDDVPPKDPAWIENALALFSAYPRLGILGGFKGYELGSSPSASDHTAEIRRRILKPEFVDPNTRLPFMFVQAANMSPMFFRAAMYRETGFDLRFSKPGESGILIDLEICMQSWLKRWQVGLYQAPITRRFGGRGSFLYDKDSRELNYEVNLELLGRLYGSEFSAMQAQADALNASLLWRARPE